MAADVPQLHKELAFTRGVLERAGRQAERSEVPTPKDSRTLMCICDLDMQLEHA